MTGRKLPIEDVLPQLIDGLRDQGQVVLRAPTGAGKTTRVPPAILDSGLAGDGRIVMLEPRRLAARTAARRMSEERGTSLGTEIGYRVRFDEQCRRETRILVVTEGILLRWLQDDPFLERVSAVLFDEFHERNLASDLLLGMIHRIRRTVRPDLRVAVMSATLDPQPIADYLDGAAIVESRGRSYKVKIDYAQPKEWLHVPELAAWGVSQALPRTTGDLLVFLPGVGEIRRAARQLEPLAGRHDLELFELYGEMPAEAQDRVLQPCPRRKLILSTNVAETSVTIEGVTTVVDTGYAKELRFDPEVGLDRLELVPISQASADQRAGRAGRTRDGYCLRLWSAPEQVRRPHRARPEILRVDLTGAVLQLKSWGETEIPDFLWLDVPAAEAIARAEFLLQRLDALDASGVVTELGRQMARLPVHPRIARLLIEGHRRGETDRAAWLAALLSERNPFSVKEGPEAMQLPTVVKHHSQSDPLDRLDALAAAERNGETNFSCGVLDRGAARFVARVRDQLIRSLKELDVGAGNGDRTPGQDGDEALLRALAVAYPDRVARRRDSARDKGVMVGGRGVRLQPTSSVREGNLFLCIEVHDGATEALVRQASIVEPEWLPASLRTVRVDLFFHPSQKQVLARRRECYEDLILSESPAPLPDDDRPAELLFSEAVRDWDQIFPRQDVRIAEFVVRVNALARWMPELELPTFDENVLRQVLRRICGRCRSFAELKKADWQTELTSLLTWDQRESLDRHAPVQMQVPSGSHVRLAYEADRPPVLAVRIQELFGLRATPRIAGGRVPVLLHLLAPNMRPEQITDDLESFWANTYPTVRKELARRYPKHPWPTDPHSAPPIRK